MKTLCFGLGLLLIVCCCDAMPKALRFHGAQRNCCGSLNTHKLSLNQVSGITESHRSCPTRAFIIHIFGGRKICYSRTSQWAQVIWEKFHPTDGSGINGGSSTQR